MQGARVRSLIRELRSCMVQQKKKKKPQNFSHASSFNPYNDPVSQGLWAPFYRGNWHSWITCSEVHSWYEQSQDLKPAVQLQSLGSELFSLNASPTLTWYLLINTKGYGLYFLVVMYGCESWTIKKAERWRIDAFELWCWRKLLRVPWTARRSNQSILKEISSECSLEGLMLKQKLRPWCWERLKAGGEGDHRGWEGWMASPTQWTWVWTSSGSWWRTGKPSLLQCMRLQSWTWLRNFTTNNILLIYLVCCCCC